MAKYYVMEKLSINLGPQLGFCLGGTSKTKYSKIETKGKIDNYEVFDFAIGVGVGYNVWNNLNVEARFNASLTNLVKNIDSKNMVVQIGAAYTF